MNRTDLGLILGALGLAHSYGLGPTATALLAGYLAGRITADRPRDS